MAARPHAEDLLAALDAVRAGITPRRRIEGGGLGSHCIIGTRRVVTHSPSSRQSRRTRAHASQLAADVLCEHETPCTFAQLW